MDLADFLRADAVLNMPQVASKKRLLQAVAESLAEESDVSQTDILDALLERELLGATGMGRGIAVPHARMHSATRVVGVFVRLVEGVDFDAIDRQPVDLVFGLLAPENAGSDHLKALARVSRTLRDDLTCQKLRSTDDPSALFAILTEPQASQAA